MSRVYISYTLQDASTAEAIRAAFARAGVECVLPPRGSGKSADIFGAGPTAQASLEASDVLLIVHSAAADYDADVIREARQAQSHGATITAVRCEPVDFAGPLAEVVGQPPSMDLFSPITLRVPQVVQSIQILLAEVRRRATESGGRGVQPSSARAASAPDTSAPGSSAKGEPGTAAVRETEPLVESTTASTTQPQPQPQPQQLRPVASIAQSNIATAQDTSSLGAAGFPSASPPPLPTTAPAQAAPVSYRTLTPAKRGSSAGTWVAVVAIVLLVLAGGAALVIFAGASVYHRLASLGSGPSSASVATSGQTGSAVHSDPSTVRPATTQLAANASTTSNASNGAQTRAIDLKAVLGSQAEGAMSTRSGNDIETPIASGPNDATTNAAGNVGPDPSASGTDPLDLLQRHDFASFDKLLAAGQVNLNQPLRDGDYPLGYAIKKGLDKQAIAIIDHGANLDLVRDDGKTFLYMAAEHGRVDVIKAICAKGVPADQPQPGDGSAPLYAAVHQRQRAAVETLLKMGADPNRPSRIKGKTPRSIAHAENYSDSAIRAMLDAPPRPTTRAGG